MRDVLLAYLARRECGGERAGFERIEAIEEPKRGVRGRAPRDDVLTR